MPQLWTETMVSQYFWLITIFFILYIINATRIIPQIAFSMKSRRFLGNTVSSSALGGASQSDAPKSFLSSVLVSPKGTDIKAIQDFSPLFDSACTIWANKWAASLTNKK